MKKIIQNLTVFTTVILSFLFVGVKSYGQPSNSRKGDIRGIIIGFTGGAELVGNTDFNHWLTSNGVTPPNSFSFCYGGKMLAWPKKIVLGYDIGGSILASPILKTSYINFLIGVPLRHNGLNIVPLIGIGENTLVQKFNDTIPEVLYQAKLTNGRLLKNRLVIEPQVMLFKKEGVKPIDLFAITIGCRIYFWQGDWRYIGDNGKVTENSIPNPSTLARTFLFFTDLEDGELGKGHGSA